MTRGITMSVKVDQYLQFRRALGYRLRIEGELLQQFAAYADATGRRGPLTVELALRWARLPEGCDRLYSARRLEVVRCFARYLSATEPHTEVPARGLLGPAHRRTTPHIYTDVELSSLISAARRLKPSAGLRPRTYATLIGLLACTGLRISEALKLVQSDVDLGHRVLKIRETKFRKTRLVPVHPTAVGAAGLHGGPQPSRREGTLRAFLRLGSWRGVAIFHRQNRVRQAVRLFADRRRLSTPTAPA